MEILRTPEERFSNLPGFPFTPRYTEVDGLRVHYVDEGPREGEPVLLMHGEPTWSYLYRYMIPPLVDAGMRAIAPDLVGFGRSDKPAAREDYTYARQVEWMQGWMETMDLRGVTLVCQDWGSLIGLRLAAENEDRFARIVVANGGLPTGDHEMPLAFKTWQKFARNTPRFPVGRLVKRGCKTSLPDEVVAAYDAPFPDDSYKAAARVFPDLVPTKPDDPATPANRRAWEVFKRWEKPFLTAYSDGDPITRGADQPFRELVPGAKDQPHTTIEGARHFLQEDKGEELARVVVDFVRRNR